MSNVSAHVSLRQGTAMCQIPFLASAATALASFGKTGCPVAFENLRLFPFYGKAAGPAVPQGSGSAPASAAPSSSARASQAKLRKTQCQAGSFIRQGQYTRSWCALRRWCQVALKSAPGGVPSSALTLPSSGQSKGCALRLPLMSNVRDH